MRYRSHCWGMLAALLPLSACTVGDITQHLPDIAPSWAAHDAVKAQPVPASGLHEWWKQFNDPSLTWLIETTLKENPDVRLAAARIEEARGLEKSSFAALFPSIDASADASRQRSSFFKPMVGNTQNAGFDASYEIDLFGKNRDASRAADSATIAFAKDYDWVKLSMAAEVTRTYVLMRAAEKQIILAERNLETEKDTLALVQRQRKAGGSSDFDVDRTALQVNQSAAHIADYKRHKETYALALITLTGVTTQELAPHLGAAGDIPGIDLSAIADTPANVIARRPDIAAANARLAQATSLKESQAAAIFPTLSISGMYGISKTLLVDTANAWSITGNAAVNLIDFGRIQGQIDAASAREVEAYETWRKAILQGLQDVESSLTSVSRIHEQRIALNKAKGNAASAVKLAQLRYRAGDSSLLDVLDAQRQQIDADSALIDAEGNYVTSIVALYKALGQY